MALRIFFPGPTMSFIVRSKDVPRPPDMSNSSVADLQATVQQFISTISHGTEAVADATGVLSQVRSQLPTGMQVHSGIIHYTIPGLGGYRVALHDLGGILQCRDGRSAYGNGDTGSKSLLPPGTRVFVLVHAHSSHIGTIIGVQPAIQADPSAAFCDFVVQGSGVGLYASPHYIDYVGGTIDSAGAREYSGDYPRDGLPGDYTVLSTTGIGLHIDNDMLFTRVSEICGLFLFREDGYARLTGETLAIESVPMRGEYGMAGGEAYEYVGHSIYPWEALGQLTYEGIDTINHGHAAIYDGSTAVEEPLRLDAVPFDRIEEHGGYIGQGHLQLVVTPLSPEGVNTLSDPVPRRALFRQQVMMDGTYLCESARQMFFAKAFDIPHIIRKHARDYLAEGEQYAANGIIGSGDPHIVHPLPTSDPAAMTAGATEYYSYATAWQGSHPAVYHPHMDLQYSHEVGPNHEGGVLSVSLEDDRVVPPEPDKVYVDPRYGEIDIARVLSLFAFLPDGGIVIRNGLGAEIKLTQGVVEVSGTGIYMHAGRTMAVHAGRAVIKSQASTELVSSMGDVRIKAEHNLSMLGGNNGRGGVLVESRGFGSHIRQNGDDAEDLNCAGVVLKAANSFVGCYGGDVLMKSGPTSAGLHPGRIVLDAEHSSITAKAMVIHNYAQVAYDHFVTNDDAIVTSHLYSSGFTVFGSSVGIIGHTLGTGSLQLGSHVSTLGHYGSLLSEEYEGRVGLLLDPSLNRRNIQDTIEVTTDAIEAGREFLSNARTALWGTDAAANDTAIKRLSFGFPSTERYGASKAVLAEPYWQQVLPVWQDWREPIVRFGDTETRPWPGKDRWEDTDGFVIIDGDSEYFDKALQRPVDPNQHRERYEQAKPPAVRSTPLMGGLKTIL